MNVFLRYRHILIVCSFVFLLFYFILHNYEPTVIIIQENPLDVKMTSEYDDVAKQWQETRDQLKNLSTLGRILYLNETPPIVDKNKQYEILVWKYGKTIEARHLYQYGKTKLDPFRKCSVNNCRITYDDDALKTADIVIFHLHRMKNGINELPNISNRNPNQIWTFATDESPHNTIYNPNKGVKLTDFNGIFNWSMSYRSDSDIPVPYGRTMLLKQPYKNFTLQLRKRRDVLVAVMGSNCGGANHRWKYINQLKKYIDVDVYGGCGNLKCPGHFHEDCTRLDNYLFYLAFENSNCDEYVTEKLWWNAYEKNAIPIIMGATEDTYTKLLPYGSYLHVDNFANPATLAEYLLHLNKTNSYQEFYQWKHYYHVYNEHGYFHSDSYYYCRICEALNYNHQRTNKVYNDLHNYWSVEKQCTPAWDEWKN